MEKFFLEWPDIAEHNLEGCGRYVAQQPSQASWAIRSGEVDHLLIASTLLTTKVRTQVELEDKYLALSFLYFSRVDLPSFESILDQLRSINPDRLEVRALTILCWLWKKDISSIASAPSGIWAGLEASLFLRICKSFYMLEINQVDEAFSLIKDEKDPPLEIYLIKARVLAAKGNHFEAVQLLKSIYCRTKSNIRYYQQLLQHQMDAKDGSDIKTNTAKALSLFGEHPQILYHCTSLNLFQRQPGLARRSALLQQVWASVLNTPIVVGNQVNSYEGNGSSDWTEYLLPSVTSLPIQANAQLHSNLIMQLASSESIKYKDAAVHLVSLMSREPQFHLYKNAAPGLPLTPKIGEKLRIGWISGDLDYHPVSRFLLGFFASSKGSLSHEHEIVSTQIAGSTSLVDFFRNGCGINVLQLTGNFDESRVSTVRSREYDIAIDLSGWTGGNFVAGFLARLAPIQVNYLGYFASSGLPTMDYWIGDKALFPPQMSEWATEQVYRLNRPFIAWKPVHPLPEADVNVTKHSPGPMRFGSFNHNRKLSDRTLRLWGKVLESVPSSRLTLKASNSTDSDTQRLLRRRMQKQGLDPERVDWLDLTHGPVEHLHQYANIDIALDPLPNGGCTTTCEALWMGVPTITLAGSNYVSRMSTAVLSGVGMFEWIAHSEVEYVRLAIEHASRVLELRNNRQHWRDKLMGSSLGDPLDLMHHLENSFLECMMSD